MPAPAVSAAPDAVPRRVVVVSTRAWRLAGSSAITQVSEQTSTDLEHLRVPEVERLVAGLTDAEADALWGELAETGLATPTGTLAPAWAAALVESALAPVAVRAVSAYEHVELLSDLTLSGDRGLGVSLRRRLAPGPLDGSDVLADDTVVEVVLFRATDIWPAVRRVLPPLEVLRADPRPTPDAVRTERSLPAASREQLQEALTRVGLASPGELLLSQAGLDPVLREAVGDPEAVVHLTVTARPAGPTARTGLDLRSWVLRDGRLHAVHVRPKEGPVLVEVQAGQVGFEVVWLVTGALQYLVGATAPAAPAAPGTPGASA